MKYSIKVMWGKSSGVSYLSFNGRSSWCKRIAAKHKREWIAANGGWAQLEEN